MSGSQEESQRLDASSDAVKETGASATYPIAGKPVITAASDTRFDCACEPSDTLTTELKERYKSYISQRDYAYFAMFSHEDRQNILREAKQTLQKQNVEKIKSKTHGMQFMEVVSHELRTPLHGLIAVIDLMQRDEMSDDQRLYIKTLEQSCAQLLSVLGRMQDLAALQHDAPVINVMPFDIVGVITGVAESVQRMTIHGRHGTLVALDLDPELPVSINGDLTKMQQILVNLVGIATTSSIAKRAKVKATFEALDDKQAKIHFVITGAHTQMPKSFLDGLDQEFSFNDLVQPLTSNNLSQGIVICQEFLKQLGTHLELEVATDDTLILKFSLDVTYNKKTVARDYEGELRGVRSAVRILVAEDNRVSRRIAIAMLSKLGFTDVVAVENGQEAIDKLEQKPFDVILMDCDMPVLDGYDAACHIRTVLKNTTVIIVALTANSTNAARQRCIAAGMDDYFTKPITIKTLTEMLHKWL
ncbi:hypothetical protein HDU89_008944 [Geranomyces variabilis]|nr:hypothetical protein HDU89_008944 [Geranomyces variabilis]